MDGTKASLIVEELRSEKTLGLFNQMTNDLEDLTAEQKGEIREFYDARVAGLAESLTDLTMDGDDSEALAALPSIWLEMRLEWNRYNNQMQYQTFNRGQADPYLMAMGACLSYIIGVVENFINSEDLFWIYKIAAGPVDAIRNRMKLGQRFFDLVESFDASSQGTLEILFQNRDEIYNLDKTVQKKMDDTILKVAEVYSDSVWLGSTDLHENMLLLLTPWLKKSALRAVLNIGDCAQDLRIAPEVATSFRHIAQFWMDNVFAVEAMSAEKERLEKGRSAHLNLSWGVEKLKGRLVFRFQDDSDAAFLPELDLKRYAHLGVTVTQELTADNQRVLTMRCDERSLHEFLVVRQRLGEKVGLFGISTNLVSRVEKNVSLVELDSSRRMVRSKSFEELPVLNLSNNVLGFVTTKSPRNSYVVIDDGHSKPFALEVEDVIGIVRGALKPSVGMKESKSSLGVVIGGEDLINILDVAALQKEKRYA